MNAGGGSGRPYQVEFIITVDDLVAYIRLLQRRLNLIGVALGLIVMSIGGLVAVSTLDAFTGVWTFVIGLLFVVLAGTEFLDRWRVKRSARSLIGSKASFSFDDEGIAADTVTGSGRVPWSSITQILENDRVMIIKRDRIPVVWIPKRAFASAEESAALVAFIQQHLTDASSGQ